VGPLPIPFACWTIIGVCALVFLYDSYAGVAQGRAHFGLLYGPAVQQGELWRLVSHVFEHGGVIHLLFNMSVVYTLGMSFERSVGTARFVLISAVTALGSATFALLFGFDKAMLGASGMILGWGGAILPIATQQGRRAVGIWLAQVAIISLLPGISWQGHLGGFVFGLPCGYILRKAPRRFWQYAPLLLVAALGAALAATHPALHTGQGQRAGNFRSADPSEDATLSVTVSAPSGTTFEPSAKASGNVSRYPTQNSSKYG
jgi:membrane associated rhomboid family serine protease